MAFSSVINPELRLTRLGDFVEIDCAGYEVIRGQVDLLFGTFGLCELAFQFSCVGGPERQFFEIDSSTRLTGGPKNSIATIDCRCFAWCRLTVAVVSATADTLARATLACYKPD